MKQLSEMTLQSKEKQQNPPNLRIVFCRIEVGMFPIRPANSGRRAGMDTLSCAYLSEGGETGMEGTNGQLSPSQPAGWRAADARKGAPGLHW